MSCHNESLKSVFIHVPKVAGTSLSKPAWNRGNGHKTVADFESILGQELESQFVWAFVRNPFERMVSAYEDCPEIFACAPTFEAFANQVWKHKDEIQKLDSIRETNVNRFGMKVGRIHFQPMSLLLKTKDGSFRPNFVGKFESLQKDFEQVCQILNVKAESLPHENKRKGKPKRRNSAWQELYTKDLESKVLEIYEEDFSRFNYSTKIK